MSGWNGMRGENLAGFSCFLFRMIREKKGICFQFSLIFEKCSESGGGIRRGVRVAVDSLGVVITLSTLNTLKYFSFRLSIVAIVVCSKKIVYVN